MGVCVAVGVIVGDMELVANGLEEMVAVPVGVVLAVGSTKPTCTITMMNAYATP